MNEPVSTTPGRPAGAWVGLLWARFDGAVMRVEPPHAPGTTSHPLSDAPHAVWAQLHAWCFAGAGDGRSPFWRPAVLPRVEQRFAVAALGQGPEAERRQLVEAFSRHLDGGDQLAAAGGRLAGLWLRLRVKRDDALWWRARRRSDPWDAGYLTGELQALQRFQPRRATLLVADGLADAVLREALRILQMNSAGYRHPVRLLVVDRSIDALAWSSTPSNSVATTEIAWPSGAEPLPAASASTASASR